MPETSKKEIAAKCNLILTPLVIGLPDLIDKELGNESTAFGNGSGYIQHNSDVVDKCQRSFMDYCYEVLGNKVFLEKKIHKQGIVGRYLDDSGTDLYVYWHRFMCIDDKYREWGQPYFAINPDKGTQRCLNDLPGIKGKFRDIKLNEII